MLLGDLEDILLSDLKDMSATCCYEALRHSAGVGG
jgi:ribosomal protein S13